MARRRFWGSGWCLGLAAAIAVFPLSATDRVGSDHTRRHSLAHRAFQPITDHPTSDMVKVTAVDRARVTDSSMTMDASL